MGSGTMALVHAARRIGVATGLGLGLLLTACAAPTPYQPAIDGFGYSEQQIEDTRFRVSFAGNSVTPRDSVENYVLYRAAQITTEQGYDYFKVVNQDTEKSTSYYNQSYFDDDFLYPYDRRRRFSRFGLGSSSGTSYPIEEYSAQADILMFKGDKPAEDISAYDARDVLQRLRSTIDQPDGA
jgi:hypothetical protein